MLLVAIPKNDRGYFRGMGLLGHLGRGLGQDAGTGIDNPIYNAEDVGYSSPNSPSSSPVDWGSVDLSGNSLPPILPMQTPVQATPPTIDAGGYSMPAITAPSGPGAPPNTVMTAAGITIPAPGFTLNAQGKVVPASGSLASLSAGLSSIPTSYWVVGILGVVLVSMAGKKRKR